MSRLIVWDSCTNAMAHMHIGEIEIIENFWWYRENRGMFNSRNIFDLENL